MYKVFFNEKLITISGQENITLNKPTSKTADFAHADDILEWFFQFIESDDTEILLKHNKPETFFHLFKSAFLNIRAAGGVVLKNNKILFIFRNGKWDLPKGKIEKEEEKKEAAIREVAEECGINGHRIQKNLPSTFHIYQSPYKNTFGKWILKETFWFEMEYSGEEKGKPETKEGISQVRWFSANELNEVLENTYENLKQIINLYCP